MATEAVMSTNDDASKCKRYATHKGYWKDNFIQCFVKGIPSRKTPEINRGYYIRHKAVYSIVNQFLDVTNRQCQIVSLGAGFDTLYWNLHEADKLPAFSLYEIDMKQVIQKKCMLIRSNNQLANALSNALVDFENAKITSDYYKLISADITDIAKLNAQLKETGLKKDIPTLFISECVFVYSSTIDTQRLLNFIGSEFSTVMLLDYDPVNFNDRFGEIMKQNLRSRQCNLLGAQPDLQSKLELYHKFHASNVKLLYDIYMDLPQEERQHVEEIEFLDEVDLLYDLLKHYCICLAFNDGRNIGFMNIKI